MKRFWLTALALSCGLTTSAFAEITGKITLDGPAPERKPVAAIANNADCAKMHKGPVLDETVVAGKAGELANVVVYLRGENLKGEVPADEVVLDQVGCVYVPHVVTVTLGQKLVATNSDPLLHNVHSLPEANPGKNFAQPVKGQKDPLPIKASEAFKVKCDIHPWMSAWVVVLDHPFHGVTGEDGIYSIDTKGLKDGEYELVFRHEKLGETAKENDPIQMRLLGTQKVTVKGGKATADFKAKAKAAAAPAAAEKEVLVSTTAAPAKAACCTDGSQCLAKAAEAQKPAEAPKAAAAKTVATK